MSRTRQSATLALPALLSVLTGACGATVPEPQFARHPSTEYTEVPYPPPSAMAEIVPEQPRPGTVWIDGQWVWRGRYWVWDKGAWVVPPRNAKFAPWNVHYREDGVLIFAPGAWRDASGRKLPPPRILLPAATPPSEQTAETTAGP